MLYSTCRYGELILSEDDRDFHSFPSVKALAEPSVTTQLQGMGFGYRSKFIQKSAAAINSKSEGAGWLYALRSAPYEEAKSQLRTLHGVGAKVQAVKGLTGTFHKFSLFQFFLKLFLYFSSNLVENHFSSFLYIYINKHALKVNSLNLHNGNLNIRCHHNQITITIKSYI